MTRTNWIIVADDAAIGTLIDAARSLGGEVRAAVVGSRAVAETVAAGGVDRVAWFAATGDRPVEAFSIAVADTVAAAPGPLLSTGGEGERVLLGAAAARLQAAVLTDVSGLEVDGESVIVTRSVFGGIAGQTVGVAGPVAVILDGGAIPAAVGSAPIDEVAASPLPISIVSTTAGSADLIDLAGSPRVVGIGRGLKAKGDLDLIRDLATVTTAEIGCSRPLVEGLSWLSKDRYIGVSGRTVAPELYFAIGISGQLQHMVGVREAGTIVAINSDPNAPVFADADYGVVGDLYDIVPALTEALK